VKLTSITSILVLTSYFCVLVLFSLFPQLQYSILPTPSTDSKDATRSYSPSHILPEFVDFTEWYYSLFLPDLNHGYFAIIFLLIQLLFACLTLVAIVKMKSYLVLPTIIICIMIIVWMVVMTFVIYIDYDFRSRYFTPNMQMLLCPFLIQCCDCVIKVRCFLVLREMRMQQNLDRNYMGFQMWKYFIALINCHFYLRFCLFLFYWLMFSLN
jgi:hypothetical protein